MSGIIGYIGKNDCVEFLISSVEKLKNRGKNNVGIAIKNQDKLLSYVGNRVSDFDDVDVKGFIGVAGVTNEQTITPCCNDSFGVVIDGKVRNRESLAQNSSPFFEITTDEEMILSLLCENNENDKISVMKNICCDIKGDITFAFISNTQNAIYVKKGNAPLVIGIADDGYYVCSELLPLTDICKKYIEPQDNSYIKITQNKISIYDSKGKKIKPRIKQISKTSFDEKTPNTLLNCPKQIEEICNMYIANDKLNFSRINFPRRTLDRISRIILTASNEEYNVAKAMCTNMELLSDIETVAISSNQLMGATGYIDKDTLVIAVSNSGEDMATISAVKRAKDYRAKTLAVTYNKLSYLARICDSTLLTIDSGVNSFQINYMALSLFAVHLGDQVGYMSDLHISLALKMSELLQGKLYSAIRNKQFVDIDASKNIIVSGFGTDYGVAKEIATSLRKACGIDAFSVSLDEISSYSNIIEKSIVLVPVSTNADFDVVVDNLKMLCQISKPIVYTTDNIANDLFFCENIITVGDTLPLFNPITVATAMKSTIAGIQIDISQLIA